MKGKNFLRLIMSFLCMLAPTLLSAQDSAYTHDDRFPFIITRNPSFTPHLSDEDFYQHSSGVIFKVNRTEIPDDDHFMKLYRDSVLPWINARHLQ